MKRLFIFSGGNYSSFWVYGVFAEQLGSCSTERCADRGFALRIATRRKILRCQVDTDVGFHTGIRCVTKGESADRKIQIRVRTRILMSLEQVLLQLLLSVLVLGHAFVPSCLDGRLVFITEHTAASLSHFSLGPAYRYPLAWVRNMVA